MSSFAGVVTEAYIANFAGLFATTWERAVGLIPASFISGFRTCGILIRSTPMQSHLLSTCRTIYIPSLRSWHMADQTLVDVTPMTTESEIAANSTTEPLTPERSSAAHSRHYDNRVRDRRDNILIKRYGNCSVNVKLALFRAYFRHV